jgi:hypothetical protein
MQLAISAAASCCLQPDMNSALISKAEVAGMLSHAAPVAALSLTAQVVRTE